MLPVEIQTYILKLCKQQERSEEALKNLWIEGLTTYPFYNLPTADWVGVRIEQRSGAYRYYATHDHREIYLGDTLDSAFYRAHKILFALRAEEQYNKEVKLRYRNVFRYILNHSSIAD